jgi:hypothetical protein
VPAVYDVSVLVPASPTAVALAAEPPLTPTTSPRLGIVNRLVRLTPGRLVQKAPNLFLKRMTITNVSDRPILGPLSLVLQKVATPQGTVLGGRVVTPKRRPRGDNVLRPGESVALDLRLRAKTRRQARYAPVSVVAGVALGRVPAIQVRSLGNASGFTEFLVNGRSVFSKTGGAGGGRGINVLRLDGGAVVDVRNFDTWGSPNTQFPLLIQYLNAVPAGTVLALAVGDEGGFVTAPFTPPRDPAVVETAYRTLELLGSRYVRQVQFRGGWGMIVVKDVMVLAEGVSAPLHLLALDYAGA